MLLLEKINDLIYLDKMVPETRSSAADIALNKQSQKIIKKRNVINNLI
jgi:hypothetical protein